MNHILHQTFKIYFDDIIKKYETLTDDPPIQTYITTELRRITFKVKTGYNLETMKLLVSTKRNN